MRTLSSLDMWGVSGKLEEEMRGYVEAGVGNAIWHKGEEVNTIKDDVVGTGLLTEEEYARFAKKAEAVEKREPDPNSPLSVPGFQYLVKQGPGATVVPLSARERLFAAHARICAEAFAIMQKKNADYASDEDPLMNFRAGGVLGIVIRKGDKAIRDINVTRKGDAAVAETLRDTRLDEINYAVLALFAEEEGMRP